MLQRTKLVILSILLLTSLAYAATQINMSRDVTGIGLVANGMTNAATTSANYMLAGPTSGAAAAYSFRSYGYSDFNIFPSIDKNFALCVPTGTTVTCLGEVSDSTEVDVLATSTLPTYTSFTSDTTGASCFDIPDTGYVSWFTGRNLTITAYAALSHTTGIRAMFGNWTGADLSNCSSEGNAANNASFFLISSSHAGSNVQCVSTDGDGSNVEDADSGFPYDTNWHKWRIKYDNAAGNVKFYIDNMVTPVCTNSTQIPVDQVMNTKFMIYCNTCGGTARQWFISRWFIETDF